MAKQSRVKKYQGQLKRENTLLKRALVQAQQGQAKATALMLGLLVQAGGDMVLSQDTTNRMNADISRMGYQVVPTAEGLVRVVLVLQEPEVTEEVPAEEAPVGKIVLTD